MKDPETGSKNTFGFRSPDAEKFPEMVVCGICFRCNARCIHCPNAATQFTASLRGADQFMEWSTLRRVADECSLYPHAMIRVSSCGEVLLHPEAVPMIEYMLDVKKDHNVALTTNGSLLSPEKSERLLAAGIRSIEFSMDAHRSETYAAIRKGLDFDVVCRNLDALIATRDRTGSPAKIIVSIIEQPANQDEINAARRHWEARVDEVLVRRLLTFKGIIHREQQYKTQLEQDAPCPFLWERVLVDAVGGVRGCVSDVHNHSLLGNVHEHPIAEIWRGEPLNSWRSLHLEGRHQEVPPCRGCLDMEYRSWTYNYFTALAKEKHAKPDRIP